MENMKSVMFNNTKNLQTFKLSSMFLIFKFYICTSVEMISLR